MSEGAEASTPPRAVLSLNGIRKFLLRIVILLSMLGLVSEFGKYYNGGIRPYWSQMLSLSYEENLPTWYSSSLIFLCGALLAAIAILDSLLADIPDRTSKPGKVPANSTR